MKSAFAFAVAAAFALSAQLAEARITRIEFDPTRSQAPTYFAGQSPTFGGLSFGSVGQYEKLRGTAFGELDPNDTRNKRITGIELAPRNPTTGMVEYSMDIFILKPIDLSKGNQKVLLDFNNRGQMRLGRLNQTALTNDPTPPLLASQWEYTSGGTAIRLLPAGPPFQQSAVYEFTYTAKGPVVSAVGLAATRDFITFLRYGTAAQGNPLAGHVQHTFSYSISQPSRTLNDFENLGFNEGEDGRRILDGILSHTGGGSGDQINYRFGQTGRAERTRQNHLYPEGVFPFAHQVMTDHLSGKTGGRDERCAASNTCPKRFEVNTSNEYWVKAGSLLHSDTRGKDLKGPDEVRYYLMSGQSHGVGDVTDRGVCREFTNGVSPYRAHRALLLALDRWVSDGVEPPKSAIPHGGHRAWANTRPGSQVGVVPQSELGWPSIPGVLYTGVITTRYVLDFGGTLDDGIISNYPQSVIGRPSYKIFVSKVDEDGNEIAGVRMPGVEAPTATTTGWALRRDEFGGPDGCESDGQNIPFARTKAERKGDPRKSLEERYKDHDGYVKAVAKAARKLQKDGFLVEEDVQSFVDEAEASDVLK